MINYMLLLLVVALGSAIYYYRRGKSDKTTSEIKSGTKKKKSIVSRVKFWGRKSDPVEQFREWAAKESLAENKQLLTWLNTLEPAEAKTFTKQVTAFGSEFNFDIAWLTKEELDNHPELSQGLNKAVAFYCLANHQACQLQNEIKAFTTFQAWQKDPKNKKVRQFGQELFAKLVDEGLIVTGPSTLFLASEEERQQQAIEAIQKIAEERRQTFNRILKQVIASNGSSEPVSIPPLQVTVAAAG